jgi:hypothetical protein
MKIIEEGKFKKQKEETEKLYKSVNKIFCPYLKTHVYFNSLGFEHLLRKSWNRGRSMIEQYTRLKLFSVVPKILSICYTLQEYDERDVLVREKSNSSWLLRRKKIYYFVFVVLMREQNIRFKIIIKQTEGGEKFFWSIYPSWSKRVDESGNYRRYLYSGNLEEE